MATARFAHLDLFHTQAMLEYLDSIIPLRAPSIKWTDREIWFYAGQRAVLDLIDAKLKEEQTPG